MLEGNIQFVRNVVMLSDLKIPDFMKDLQLLFTQDIHRNLSFLLENLHKKLRESYSQKEIYQYVSLNFSPKEVRTLDNKRRDLIKIVENAVIVKFKKPISSPLGK